MSRVIVVTAKNRRTASIETRRFTTNSRITKEDAIGRMGHWLGILGWQAKEILIVSSIEAIEDTQSQMLRERLLGP